MAATAAQQSANTAGTMVTTVALRKVLGFVWPSEYAAPPTPEYVAPTWKDNMAMIPRILGGLQMRDVTPVAGSLTTWLAQSLLLSLCN